MHDEMDVVMRLALMVSAMAAVVAIFGGVKRKVCWWMAIAIAAAGLLWSMLAHFVDGALQQTVAARLLSLAPAFGIAFAIPVIGEATTNTAGKLARRAAIERVIIWSALVAGVYAGSGAYRHYWPKTDGTTEDVEKAMYVRGVVRDPEYIRERLSERQMNMPADGLDAGSVWDTSRPLERIGGQITVAGLHDLRAGYTLELAETLPKVSKGWLRIRQEGKKGRPELTSGALDVLKGVYERQALADARRWPGHWSDPFTGENMPVRFYQNPEGKYIRVAGKVLHGPEGERVFDLSLYWGHKELVEAVKKDAANLNTPYMGGRAPLRATRLF